MRAHTKAVLLAVLLASNPRAFALSSSLDISQYAHTAWRSAEGFPVKGVITGIAQTPDGYLWIATEFGTLLRFDGVRTVPLKPSIHEKLLSMFASRDGTLWIGSDGGLASWKAGTLTKYSELEGNYVNSFAEDGEGTVWVGLSWDPGGGRVCAIRRGTAQCSPAHGSLGRYVRSLCSDGDKLWVYGESGLWQWKPAPARQSTVQKPEDWFLSRMSCTNDAGGSLIAIPGGVSQIVDGEILPFRLPDSPNLPDPTSMLRDRDGGLWIGTASHGLLHVHEGRTDRFTRSDGLSGDSIRALFEDLEGSIWVATLDGLDRFRERAVPSVSVSQGLSRNDVWSVLGARDGSVWIGSRDGLHRWKDGRFTRYPSGGGLGNNPGSLFEDERGRIWASTSRGLTYFSEGRFTPVTREPSGQVHSITEDRGGRLWFSEDFEGRQTIGSLEVGAVGGHVGEVHRIPGGRLGLELSSKITLSPDLRGGLWIGARNALAYFKDGAVEESYTTVDGRRFRDVSGLYSDAEGTLWAAADAGLLRLRDGRLTMLTSANGLPCAPPVWWVTEDDDRSLWLSLNCGVARIRRPELEAWVADTKRTVAVTIFDNADGVRQRWNPSQGYGPIATRSRDGKVWFIGMDGVGVIDPRRLSHNGLPPPVHIERIAANGELYWQNLTAMAPSILTLPPVIRDLEIEFTALSLAVPDKVRFRYKLEGQDPDWKEVANERKVQYSNLAPGSYRFRVIASNNSGVWNEVGDALSFDVAPAYYQTNWFRALCAILLLLLAWAGYQLRVRTLHRQFEMTLDARVAERTRIARDLHDTLLQSFHGLLLRFQTALNLLPDRPAESKQVLASAIDQAGEAITEGRDAVQGLRTSATEMNDLADSIRALGEELADENSAQAILRVEVQGTPRVLHPIVRDEVFRIAGEALRNAFRHAAAKQVEVELRYDERQLRVRVRDDGKGIDPEVLRAKGREGHFGLGGMRERAKLAGGKLTVWSGLDTGTEVELSIPAPRAYSSSSPPRSWLPQKVFGPSDTSDS
jgi:signal transduction histidine kinase/ligand-binding sensor domain-containing protein